MFPNSACSRFPRLAVTCVVLLITTSPIASQDWTPAPTTEPAVSVTEPSFTSAGEEVSRSAKADVNGEVIAVSALRGAGDPLSLTLELFDGQTEQATFERLTYETQETMTWIGSLDGVPQSRVYLTVSGEIVSGLIQFPDKLLQVRYDGESHFLEEVPPQVFEADWDPPPMFQKSTGGNSAAQDDGNTFDLMVVYSAAARSAAGGHAAIRTRIANGVAVTNDIMSVSGVIPRIRLVHTAEVEHQDVQINHPITGEPQLPNGSAILANLVDVDDGILDEVPSLRDQHQADLVVMGVRFLQPLGRARAVMVGSNNTAFESEAYALVRGSSLGGFVVAHELGHLFGSHHDREHLSTPPPPGAFPFSYAYLEPQETFVTLMGAGGNTATRLLQFSTPNLQSQGLPTGTPDHDNVSSINGVRSVIANFRSSGGGCPWPAGHANFCRDCGPCGPAQGDCDNDGECAPGLTCVENIGPQFGWGANVDVCMNTQTCTLDNGDPNYCADPACGPCGVGEADCDSDDECFPGLVCSQNVGAQYGFHPNIDVCEPSGQCILTVGDPNYCSDPACGPCGIGEGDCDQDSECNPGLHCEQQPGVDTCEAAGIGTPTTLTLEPVADTFVANDWPNTNYGTDPEMRVRYAGGDGLGHPRFSFIQFEVPQLSGAVISATLRLRTQNVAIDEVGAYSIDIQPWVETALTWNNWGDPTQATFLGSQLGLQPFTYRDFDVTEAVQGGGFVTLGLSAGGTADFANQDFDTRETNNPPTLTIVHE